STHNGQGNIDAQHNSIVSDSDALDATSPAWFINQSHAYPIDGIKTQSIDSSRTGDATKDSVTNGYNQLMFDAHPESPQINAYSSSYHVNTPFLTQHHRRIIKPPACTQQVSYH
ncbi:hypothetical protein ACT3RO_15985, partial [Psychrobacter sp. AOP5-CZ1-12]|uniref:hypothetical protein n=1 Tax=Psychrobacter sp. AOP5-CZ1-12 TaxID=3457651 RepID=UPI00402B8C9D